MLLPVTCPVCATRGAAPCARCVAALRPAPSLPPPPGVDGCHALFAYEGAARRLVTGLKYANHRAALPGLARALASLAPAGVADAVTWAPTSDERRRRRGFDQSQLLARAVARQLRLPCRRLLRRGPGPPQTGRAAADRWSGPAFVAHRSPFARIVLVDDVVTTGATVAAAARALRQAGAATVLVVAVARTPLKPTTESDEGIS